MTDTPSALEMAAQLLRQHADSIAEGRPADPAILRAAARTIEEHLADGPQQQDALVCEWLHQVSEQYTITHQETAVLREALARLAGGVEFTGTTVQLSAADLSSVAGRLAEELERRVAVYESLETAAEFYAGTIVTLRRAAETARGIESTVNAHR
ncbi:hypothetical protein ACFY2K_42945 [Kitasatospora sp. NPDC001309]|uniref:hypothetical protein n=1 Tax=Kitasatospora sp. NPDC001309 TaxID=3364013 RepID=UPI003677483F